MDEIIILALQGKEMPEQLEELRRWREASPKNERRWQELRAVWALSGQRIEIDASSEVPRAEELLRRGLAFAEAPPQSRAPRRRWPIPMAAAAVLLLAVGLAYLTTSWRVEEPISMVEFSTAPDELRTVVLANGTVIRLAPNSTLLAAPGEDLRSVWLQGRAFFAVARHPHRRFAVQTPHGTVSVLGTRFEVGTVDDGLRLLVLDGQVAFAAEGGKVELEGGELAHSSSASAPVVTRLDAPEKLLDWMGPWVAFESTPLGQVARELEARLGIRIQIGDSALADRTITGWMDEADQDQMMKMICRVAGVRCTQVGDVLRMER